MTIKFTYHSYFSNLHLQTHVHHVQTGVAHAELSA
jgi:hypothetical protein